MSGLPHGLTPPLHLLEPWWQRPAAWLLAAFVLIVLVAWWRRRRSQRPHTSLPPPPVPAPVAGGIAAAVRRLRERYRGAADLRRGLQELSGLLRRHFAAALPAAERHPGVTAVELARHLGEVPAARLLRLVAQHQFGRGEPTAEEFDAVCELAEAAVEGRRAQRRRAEAAGPKPSGGRRKR